MQTLRRRPPNDGPNPYLWLLTYSDMVTQLMAFFVVLVTLSSLGDESKVQAALNSIQQSLGVLPANTGITSVLPTKGTGRITAFRLMRLTRELRERMQILGLEKDIKLELESGGLRISLSSQILFDPASAAVKPDAIPVLRDLAEMLASQVADATIQSRGYTDDRPLTNTSAYQDNYDLAYARAKAVVEQLVGLSRGGDQELILDRFEIISLGPSNPVATNDTEEGRSANRRVELFILQGQEPLPSFGPLPADEELVPADGSLAPDSVPAPVQPQ
jgi:chemotaxis protein MotB